MEDGDRHTLLGRLVDLFNQLEVFTHVAAWHALGLGELRGRTVTQRLSIDQLRELLERCVKNEVIDDPHLRDVSDVLVSNLKDLNDRRNIYVHAWPMKVGEDSTVQVSIRTWLKTGSMSSTVDPSGLTDLIADINRVTGRVAEGLMRSYEESRRSQPLPPSSRLDLK